MKKLVIMAGLPGSGKSYIRERMFADLEVVDCDEIKKTLPGYDSKNPGKTHRQSKVIEKQRIYNNLANGTSFVFDTTATNSDTVIALTVEAQGLGYEVELVYVKTTLATALDRNSKRERVVPEYIILEKYEQLTYSLKNIKQFVNKFTVVDND